MYIIKLPDSYLKKLLHQRKLQYSEHGWIEGWKNSIVYHNKAKLKPEEILIKFNAYEVEKYK